MIILKYVSRMGHEELRSKTEDQSRDAEKVAMYAGLLKELKPSVVFVDRLVV